MSLSITHLRVALEEAPVGYVNRLPPWRDSQGQMHYFDRTPYRSMVAPAPWIMRGQNQLISLAVIVLMIFSTMVYAFASQSGRSPPRAQCPKGTVMTACGCQPPDRRLTWGDCV